MKKLAMSAIVLSGTVLFGAGLSGCEGAKSTDTLVADARQYQQKGDIKAAVIQLKNALDKNADDPAARLLLGQLYVAEGDAVSAEKELRRALALKANRADAIPALAKALLMQQQWQKVLDETAADLSPGSAELLTARGNAYLALVQADNAKAAFEHALALKPGDVDAMIGMARHALLQKDMDGAVRFSDEAVGKNPRSAEALLFVGTLRRVQSKPQEAIAAYEKAIAIEPGHRSAYLEKALVEISLKQSDAATASIAAARKISPNNPMVTYAEALLQFTDGKPDAARESLQKILRVAPEHMPSILLAGAVEFQLNATQLAEQHLKKYVQANPENAYARKLLITTLLKLGHTNDALAALAPAMEGKPDAQMLALAGEAHMQAREFDKSSDYFQKASAMAPESAGLHTALAMAKLGQGDTTSAISALEVSTRLNAKSTKAGILLANTEMRLKHYDKALAAIQPLEASHPTDPMVPNLKGGIYLAKKDMVNARASFEKALTVQPGFFPAVANLAQMDVQMNKPDAARERLEAFVKKDSKSIEAMTALAQLAAGQGKADVATTWLERATSENTDALAPAMMLVSQYQRTRQLDKALVLARKLQTAHPANPDVLDLLGQSQIMTGDHGAALETYSKLSSAAPKSATAHVRLAAVHVMMKNQAAAAEDLKRALAVDPDNLTAMLAQADLTMRKGDTELALQLARKIQAKHERSEAGFLLEGDILQAQGKQLLAVAQFEKAFARQASPQILVKIVLALEQAGKVAEADSRMAQWQQQNPADAVVPMHAAEMLLARRQFKAAIVRLEALTRQYPTHAIALNNLAWAYQQEKDGRALATAEKAYQLAGENPAVLDTLGWMLIEQGKVERGLPLVRKALSMAHGSSDIRYHVAVGLFKSGDKAGARKEIEHVLASGKPFAQADEARALLKQL